VTAVEVPQNLRAALTDYPQCERRTQRPGGIVERCAKPSEWGIRCNNCRMTTLLCEEHAAPVAQLQTVQACAGCRKPGLIPLRWTFVHLRCES
jgi:hypothetical protein